MVFVTPLRTPVAFGPSDFFAFMPFRVLLKELPGIFKLAEFIPPYGVLKQ